MIQRNLTFEAPIETAYRIISDFESYPEFLSTSRSAKERRLKSGLFVDFAVDVVKEIHYTLQFELEEPTLISWKFVKGDLMKKNSGRWLLEKASSDKTNVTYEIDIDFGWLVPKMILEQVTKTQLPDMLNAFKTRIENEWKDSKKKEKAKR